MPDESTSMVPRDQEAALRVREKLLRVPGVNDDPTGRMLDLIEGAESPEEWAAIWEKVPSIRDYEGGKVTVHDIRLRESSFEGQDYYLLVDLTRHDTGERLVVSSSSTMVNLQLAKAFTEGWLPLAVEVRGPKRPTKEGFRPLHLHALEPEELKKKAAG